MSVDVGINGISNGDNRIGREVGDADLILWKFGQFAEFFRCEFEFAIADVIYRHCATNVEIRYATYTYLKAYRRLRTSRHEGSS